MMLVSSRLHTYPLFFFFNDPAPTEIYTLSLHDALPISHPDRRRGGSLLSHGVPGQPHGVAGPARPQRRDRKSTRLNSSHVAISYAVFCLKKKKRTGNIVLVRAHSMANLEYDVQLTAPTS